MPKGVHLPTVLQGQAGVHRVLSELILRGHRPYLPSADTGIDILLESGLRIQVKSTMRASSHYRLKTGTFLFTLGRGTRVRQGKVTPLAAREFSRVCDFVVLWAIEPDRFWVVPSNVLDGRHTATISTSAQWRNFDADQVKAFQAQGLTIQQIADQLGVAPRTVTRRLSSFQTPVRKYTDLPQYEGGWHRIVDTIATLAEGEAKAVAGSAFTPAVMGVEPLTFPAV